MKNKTTMWLVAGGAAFAIYWFCFRKPKTVGTNGAAVEATK
jgi:hypothetical protein